MPLRDHFHGELLKRREWESFLGCWPTEIIRQVNTRLPPQYHGQLQVHYGASFNDGPPNEDIVEATFHDSASDSTLVAAVELVSPGNKDCSENRHIFAVKCRGYLQRGASVVVVDVVTNHHANLHVELMELLGHAEAPPWPTDQELYAVAYRTTQASKTCQLEMWTEPLSLGQALPTLPLWLASNLAVPLELEPTYEETCQVLRIR